MKSCVAVVVTHNSELLIRQLLESLLEQTITLHKIIIIDNNSVDNTVNIINSFDNSNELELVELKYNIGGSGGFKEGFERAIGHDADYIITFDDDALPLHDDCIELLLDYAMKFDLDVVAPLVISNEDKKQTAYKYKLNGRRINDVSILVNSSASINDIKLFNGVLFKNIVVKICGLPNPKFFIRGDEEDYKQRMIANNLSVAVNTKAKVSHPLSSNEYVEWKNYRYHYTDHVGKRYFSTRNKIYMLMRNKNMAAVSKVRFLIKEFYKYINFYIFYRKFDFSGLAVWKGAFFDGLFGNMDSKRAEHYIKSFNGQYKENF